METRANHVWVGAVTLVILVALAIFIVWVAGWGQNERTEYDVFFEQSVEGLSNGSQVTFNGVPAGEVKDISLWKADVQKVRVRIAIKDEVPVPVCSTATMLSSFTGVSTILLEGPRGVDTQTVDEDESSIEGRIDCRRLARRIDGPLPKMTCENTACPLEGVPAIRPKQGGFGAIIADAPRLLERISVLTDRLSEVMSPENQEQLSGILRNTNEITAELADASPQLEGTLAELQITLREASEALDAFERTTESTNELINSEGGSLAEELRTTIRSWDRTAQSLDQTLEQAQPAVRTLNDRTLPAANATIEDLQATSRSLRSLTERLEDKGATDLLSSPKLPDYEPEE